MKVYRKIGAFRGDSALSSWIYRITFNTAMSRLRNGKFSRPNEVLAGDLVSRTDDGADTNPLFEAADWSNLGDESVMRRQMRDAVMAALKDLDDVAYVRFASVYRSFRDVEEFARELDALRERGAKKPAEA